MCWKIEFRSRLRLFAHVTDRRRKECKQFHMEFVPLVSELEYQAFEQNDSTLLRQGRREGCSHVIVQAPATTASGTRIGRVQK